MVVLYGQYFKNNIKKLLKKQGIDAVTKKCRSSGWVMITFKSEEDKLLFILVNGLKQLNTFKGYYTLPDIK